MGLKIVMVAEDAASLRSVARTVARLRPSISFEGFADPVRALARMQAIAPDLLIADVRMEPMSGAALVAAVRSATSALPSILLAEKATDGLRQAVVAAPGLEVLEKPVPTEMLLAAIDRVVAGRTVPKKGFSGKLRLPMLPDLIQVLALSRASVSVVVRASGVAEGEDEGTIWFREGEIIHAAHGALVGPDAFYSLLALEGGRFTSEPCLSPPARTIDARWEELLMEGLRRVDEASPRPGAETSLRDESAFAPDELRALRQALPQGEGELVVVAFRPSAGAAAFVSGVREAETDSWTSAIAGMAGSLRGLSGEPVGYFEDVREGLAIALSWSWPEDRVVLIGHALESASSVARFRLRASAFHRAVTGPGGGA